MGAGNRNGQEGMLPAGHFNCKAEILNVSGKMLQEQG
jgi:hypothetical protein